MKCKNLWSHLGAKISEADSAYRKISAIKAIKGSKGNWGDGRQGRFKLDRKKMSDKQE